MNREFAEWWRRALDARTQLVLPEIADYEVRRELLRANLDLSLARLDGLASGLRYEALTTGIMRRAAQLWADARNRGRPTAPEAALDADVILAATALELQHEGDDVLIVTTNVGHLAQFAPAALWTEVTV